MKLANTFSSSLQTQTFNGQWWNKRLGLNLNHKWMIFSYRWCTNNNMHIIHQPGTNMYKGYLGSVYGRCRGPSSPMVALQIGRVYHILTSWEKLKLHEIEEFEFFLLEVGLLSPYQLDGYLSKRAFGLSFRWLVAVRLLCLFRCQLSCWVDY